MSTLTKVLIVLLTVFSIFLCGIVVTYVANAENYRKTADSQRSQVQSMRNERNAAVTDLEEHQKATEQMKAEMNQQLTDLQVAMQGLQGELDKVKRENAQLVQDIAKMNVKESFNITLTSGRTICIPFEELDDLARPSSLVCTEFANDFADLAAGGLGSPDGYTTILLRSDEGKTVYDGALLRGYIEERVLKGGVGSRSERAAMMARVVEFARWKRERGEAHHAGPVAGPTQSQARGQLASRSNLAAGRGPAVPTGRGHADAR